jgi:hypothetical protein
MQEVHRSQGANLQCLSKFFEKGFKGDFKEAVERTLYLPTDTPGSFRLLVEWLYCGNIPDGHSQQHLHDLYNVWILAHKLGLKDLMGKPIFRIQDISAAYDELVDVDIIRKVYKGTPAKSPLRNFCISLLVYEFAKQRSMAMRSKKGSGSKFVMDVEDFKNLWELSNDYFDFFYDFFSRYQTEDGDSVLVDPRLQTHGNKKNKCSFYCHKNDAHVTWMKVRMMQTGFTALRLRSDDGYKIAD